MQAGHVQSSRRCEGALEPRSAIEVTVRCETGSAARDSELDICDLGACGLGACDCRFLGDVLFGEGFDEGSGFDNFEDDGYPLDLFDDEEEDDDPRSLSPRELGRRGEDAACELLRRKDYVILERNWTCPAGEADIVALDEGCIVFVEVKTRAGVEHGLPEEAVTPRKRAKYERIAGFFLNEYDGPDARVRFDVVGILALSRGRALARHVVNAFGAGD